jgi:hypothetical protein
VASCRNGTGVSEANGDDPASLVGVRMALARMWNSWTAGQGHGRAKPWRMYVDVVYAANLYNWPSSNTTIVDHRYLDSPRTKRMLIKVLCMSSVSPPGFQNINIKAVHWVHRRQCPAKRYCRRYDRKPNYCGIEDSIRIYFALRGGSVCNNACVICYHECFCDA